jgi:hypothetical protein
MRSRRRLLGLAILVLLSLRLSQVLLLNLSLVGLLESAPSLASMAPRWLGVGLRSVSRADVVKLDEMSTATVGSSTCADWERSALAPLAKWGVVSGWDRKERPFLTLLRARSRECGDETSEALSIIQRAEPALWLDSEQARLLRTLGQEDQALAILLTHHCLYQAEWCVGRLLEGWYARLGQPDVAPEPATLEALGQVDLPSLAADYMLWRSGERDPERLQRLKYPSMLALYPEDSALRRFTLDAVVGLTHEGIWPPQQSVISFADMLWQGWDPEPVWSAVTECEQLLPAEPWWSFLRKLHSRDSASPSAQPPCGDGDDNNGCLRSVLADLLGQSANNFTVGPPLIDYGNLNASLVPGSAGGWHKSPMADGIVWDLGLFTAGADHEITCLGKSSLRVSGVWVRGEKSDPARSGYEYLWDGRRYRDLEPGKLYLLTFVYRTGLETTGASVWSGGSTAPPILFPREHVLPDTKGECRRFVAVGRATDASARMELLMRLWGTGIAWFDAVELRSFSTIGDLPALLPVVTIR